MRNITLVFGASVSDVLLRHGLITPNAVLPSGQLFHAPVSLDQDFVLHNGPDCRSVPYDDAVAATITVTTQEQLPPELKNFEQVARYCSCTGILPNKAIMLRAHISDSAHFLGVMDKLLEQSRQTGQPIHGAARGAAQLMLQEEYEDFTGDPGPLAGGSVVTDFDDLIRGTLTELSDAFDRSWPTTPAPSIALQLLDLAEQGNTPAQARAEYYQAPLPARLILVSSVLDESLRTIAAEEGPFPVEIDAFVEEIKRDCVLTNEQVAVFASWTEWLGRGNQNMPWYDCGLTLEPQVELRWLRVLLEHSERAGALPQVLVELSMLAPSSVFTYGPLAAGLFLCSMVDESKLLGYSGEDCLLAVDVLTGWSAVTQFPTYARILGHVSNGHPPLVVDRAREWCLAAPESWFSGANGPDYMAVGWYKALNKAASTKRKETTA